MLVGPGIWVRVTGLKVADEERAYEVTRCLRLRESSVSTGVLYGNFKTRSPFPHLSPVTTVDRLDPAVQGVDTVRTCSVCDGLVNRELHQATATGWSDSWIRAGASWADAEDAGPRTR